MIGSQPFEMVFPWFPVPASPDFPAFPTPNSPLWPQKVAHWHPQRQSVGWSKFLVYLRSLYSTPCKNGGSEWFLGAISLQQLVLLVVPHFPYTAYPLSKAPVAVSSYRAKVGPDQGQHNSLTNVISLFDLLKCSILANHWFKGESHIIFQVNSSYQHVI